MHTTTVMEPCCTCAQLLSAAPRYDASSEKPLPDDRRVECCGRIICGSCVYKNPRFRNYCPYCQISQTSSALPPGLKDPPSYTSAIASKPALPARDRRSQQDQDQDPDPDPDQPPPPYTPSSTIMPSDFCGEKKKTDGPAPSEPAQDILHFLDQPHDTVASLSLRYGISAAALRRANNIHSDHLIQGRRTVVIPGARVSLSPRPVGGEDEERRKARIRRWMVRCRVHEYDVAVLYLEQAGYDLEAAVERYLADEEWERAHPLEARRRGKRVGGGGAGSGSGRVTMGLWGGRG
ncbi:hypothetical protein DL771_000092 [Monosporascus sp. 5C6A]|nr:hypothetical protein DL771_000092 [Monosporascus sp. 5C6A]